MFKYSIFSVLIASGALLTFPGKSYAADVLLLICYESELQGRLNAKRHDRLFVVTQNPGTGVDGSHFVENL
ncbi:hypothetical protein [Ruegeria sp. HKCCSP335]|uniref:hypothetical protein n=1 Tax=Ruegeria sp. HKCCSP335 TaxID=2794833 RepID=UPI001AE7B357|nr:hypothetical protein [Ruegeria sp. HKCCSP335]